MTLKASHLSWWKEKDLKLCSLILPPLRGLHPGGVLIMTPDPRKAPAPWLDPPWIQETSIRGWQAVLRSVPNPLFLRHKQ